MLSFKTRIGNDTGILYKKSLQKMYPCPEGQGNSTTKPAACEDWQSN